MITESTTTPTGPNMIVVPRGATPDGRNKATITAMFRDVNGTALPVKITLFQIVDGLVGVGVYPTEDRGTVLRWDRGVGGDPSVIYWSAPHCADDECGDPCDHRKP